MGGASLLYPSRVLGDQ